MPAVKLVNMKQNILQSKVNKIDFYLFRHTAESVVTKASSPNFASNVEQT